MSHKAGPRAPAHRRHFDPARTSVIRLQCRACVPKSSFSLFFWSCFPGLPVLSPLPFNIVFSSLPVGVTVVPRSCVQPSRLVFLASVNVAV